VSGRPHNAQAGIRRLTTETGEPKVILTALCGHGHLDLAAYAAFLSGELTDHELQTEEITQYLAGLPEVPASA
jgi:tryptophan synthase beta chain